MAEAVSIKDFLIDPKVLEKTEKIKFKNYPKPWVVRSVSQDELEQITSEATKKIVNRVTRQTETTTDNIKIMELMVSRAVKQPDLSDSGLQAHFGATGLNAGKVAKKMLTAGEYADLVTKINEISGLVLDFDDVVDEVKN